MALAAGIREAGRDTGRERRSHVKLADAGEVQGTRGEKPAWRGARESDPQESCSLVEDLSHRGWYAARQGTRVAQYLHADQEPGRIADHQTRRWVAGCCRASGDCGDIGIQAVPRVE